MSKNSYVVKNTWLNYLETAKGRESEHGNPSLTGFDNFFNANRFARSFFRHSIPYVYLLDYKRGEYLNMSENFGGYEASSFLKQGISHTLEIYHRDHLMLFDKQIFPERLKILKSIRPDDHKNHVFTFNLSVKNRNGVYENFLQRNCFLSDSQGNPVLSMGILIDINHYNQTNRVIQTVEKIDVDGLATDQTIYKGIYYLNQEDRLFSKREKEVLLWMSDGLSSKMIANKLSISENTVINHRRSMQEKSNMPNAVSLVSFALRGNII